MADNVVDQVQDAQAVDQTQPQEFDLAAQMAIALGGGIAPQPADSSTDASVAMNGAVATDATDAGAAAPGAAISAPSQDDPFGIFKEKFGYETPDAAIKDIEELRAFKAQPRAEEFYIPDDESGAILRAIAAGKREEVWKHLDQELRIEKLVNAEITKDTAADIVKMGMQMKYKDFTPAEIDYKFNKQFGIPQEPVQLQDEEDVDYQARVTAWKDVVMDKQMDLIIEAKTIRPELQNAKTKFVIPDIATPIDEGYIQYKQMLEAKPQLDAEVKEAYKAFTPKAVETRINFKDEANKIDFEFQYEPKAEKLSKAVEIACDADLFWKTFTNSDGTPNRLKFIDAILYSIDKEEILKSALNQGKNAGIKSGLVDNSQSGGLIRQMPQTQELSELDKQMAIALGKHARR